MPFLIALLLISAFLFAARLASADVTGPLDAGLWLFGGAFLFAGWRLARATAFYRRIRGQGWRIPVHRFLLDYGELGGRRGPVPPREDWMALPSADPARSETWNLRQAMALAAGWDEETAAARRLEVVYSSLRPELVGLAADVLRSRGFPVETRADQPIGVFGVRWDSRVLVPGNRAREAREVLAKWFEEDGGGADAPQDAGP